MRSWSERWAQVPWFRVAAGALGVVALGALGILCLQATFLTSDALMALAWGGELRRGDIPDVTAPLLPVQHPLPTALGALLSPFGSDAMIDGYRVWAVVWVGVLAYACFRLARRFGGAAAGVLAVALVLTRPQIAQFAWSAQIDIPFTALALLAAALIVEDEVGNRWKALTLLAVGGLLRHEAWLLAAIYGGWLAVRAGAKPRPATVALVLCAPALWACFDLVLTGDPLSTAGQARASFADQLVAAGYQPGSPGEDRFGWLPGHDYLEPLLPGLPDLLGWPLAVAGVMAAIYVVSRRRAAGPTASPDLQGLARVVVVPLAVLVAVILFKVTGFPYSDRFVVLPAVALTTLAAAAAVHLGSSLAVRVVTGVAVVAILVALPRDLDRLEELRLSGRSGVAHLDDVRTLTRRPMVEAASECGPLGAGGLLSVTVGVGVLAIELDRDPAEITVRRIPPPPPASALVLPVPGEVDLSRWPGPVIREGTWGFAAACGGGAGGEPGKIPLQRE